MVLMFIFPLEHNGSIKWILFVTQVPENIFSNLEEEE